MLCMGYVTGAAFVTIHVQQYGVHQNKELFVAVLRQY